MKVHTVKLKQENILCHKCVVNVVRALSYIDGIQELEVSLKKKSVKIIYDNKKFSRQIIQDIVNESIVTQKVNTKYYQ